MTRQEIFDKVARHLLTQGRKAENPATETCMYRGPDGTMCAVGCLIPDDKYTPEIEGCVVESIWAKSRSPRSERMWALFGELGLSDDLHMLAKLQRIHDGSDVEEWRSELRDLAADFSLSPAVLESCP